MGDGWGKGHFDQAMHMVARLWLPAPRHRLPAV